MADAAYSVSAEAGGSIGSTQQISDREFNEVRALIRKYTGIAMNDTKRQLVCRRLNSRLMSLGMSDYKDYIDLLKSGDPTEVEVFSNAVTTNLTAFFREKHHFDFLKAQILPEIEAAKGGTAVRRLRIWSAGCSTGEEPYSIAITLRDSMSRLVDWDAKILATDIDSNVLATGKTGVYSKKVLDRIPENFRKRAFKNTLDEKVSSVEISDELRRLITFNRLNLMQPWPMRGPFDVIFCRNVIIYFDKPTQRTLINRYAELLAEGGYLILGHSENLFNVSDRFLLIGKTIYRKQH